MTGRRPDATGGVQSVDRAVTVLEILARTGGSGVGDVAVELGVHKSTASRLLSALEERELVEADGAERGRYRLGVGLLRLAAQVTGRLDLARQADPVLRQLADELGETVNLAVLRGHHAVNVADARGPAALAAQNWVGRLTPLHATSSGKVLLASLGPAARARLLDEAGLARFTDRTPTDRAALERELQAVRHDGRATAVDELEDGLSAVAAPVHDHTGDVVAAVSLSGPTFRLDAVRLREAGDAVAVAARRISERLGRPLDDGH